MKNTFNRLAVGTRFHFRNRQNEVFRKLDDTLYESMKDGMVYTFRKWDADVIPISAEKSRRLNQRRRFDVAWRLEEN